MIDKPYFTHDIGAKDDPKLVEAERASRGLYKAIWWDLVDMLHANDGYLPMDFPRLAYILRYPKAEEVEDLVMNFNLFENDGERIWNASALDRIQTRNNLKEKKSEGGRRSGETRRGRNQQDDVPNSDQTVFEDSSEDTSSTVPNSLPNSVPNYITNKLTNKQKNSLSPGARTRAGESGDEETRERIFEIFFFKNFADPVGEVERFCEFYNPDGAGWKNSNGRRLTNIQRVAEEWRPEKSGNRFSAKWLEWFKAVYAAAKTDGDGIDNMLSTIRGVYSQGPARFFVDCADRRVAETIGNFVKENDLERGLEVRFGTKS